MQPPPPEIGTERLRLRFPMPDDAEEIYSRYAYDIEVARYMSWKPHQSITDTHEFLERVMADREFARAYSWLIYLRESGSLLGSIGCSVQGTRLQFGYCLARDAWGYGFATEATRAFVEAVFADNSIWRVQAFCDHENRASARVLKKAGLELEGTLRRYLVMPNLGDRPRDVFCYAKVRD